MQILLTTESILTGIAYKIQIQAQKKLSLSTRMYSGQTIEI